MECLEKPSSKVELGDNRYVKYPEICVVDSVPESGTGKSCRLRHQHGEYFQKHLKIKK